MDINKLKLDSFDRISIMNFPTSINVEIEPAKRKINAVLYYVNFIEDLYKFIDYCESLNLPDDNRVIMVFKSDKQKGVTRNTIMAPFNAGKFPKFKLKAPMICSVSDELTACVFRKVNDTELQDDTEELDE